MPFVIGVMGAGGPVDKYGPDQRRYRDIHQGFRDAMAAPAAFPEFQGTVTAVYTEKYWDLQLGELDRRSGQIGAKNRELKRDTSLSDEQRKAALEQFEAKTVYSRRAQHSQSRQVKRCVPLSRLGKNPRPDWQSIRRMQCMNFRHRLRTDRTQRAAYLGGGRRN